MATSRLRPPEPARRRQRNANAKARVHRLLRQRLSPAAFERAVGGYHGVRSAIGLSPGRGRMMPDFLLVGAAKCGTTSLFDWICAHPLVARPSTSGRPRKELLFFDYNFYRGADWYRQHFPLERDRREFEREHGRRFLTGEATASYLTGHWVPGRVRRLLPDVKLIVTLRNPVDRAYSAFQMSRRERLEECESFEQALSLEPQRLAGELERARSDPSYNPPLPPPLGYWSYLHRSRYADHVERWLELFGQEQVLFLRFEDLVADPSSALARVYGFLGLPPHRAQALHKLNAATYSEMSPRTRAELVEHFRPYNQRLRDLTGIDFEWDR
jgi:sulfotransferase family protein